MSITADAQCFLQIVGFRNVGLIRTGLYKLRVGVSHSQGIAGEPVYMIAGLGYKQLNHQRLNLGSSEVLQEEKLYSSNAFLIEQSKDYVRIGDVCKFTITLNVSPGLDSALLIISARLMYCSSFSRVYHGQPAIPSEDRFSEEALVRIAISQPLRGVHEFYQATFDDLYCSTLDLVVHTSIAQFHCPQTVSRYLFPNVTQAGAQQSDLESAFLAYVGPHANHLQEMQDSIAALRPSIRNFDTNVALRLSQSVVFPGVRLSDAVAKQYWEYLYQHSFGCNADNSVAWVDFVLNEVSRFAQELFELLFTISVSAPDVLLIYFQGKFLAQQSLLYENAIFREARAVDCIPLENNDEVAKTHGLMAKARRFEQRLPTRATHLEDAQTPAFTIDTLPILFEDSYASPSAPMPPPQVLAGSHLVVLVHGYDGTPTDLIFLRNHLAKKFHEHTVFMCSKCNESSTKGDIFDMGRRLAQEIRSFNDEHYDEPFSRLSLVGYSLGGLVARAALVELQDWCTKMHAFVTLSSPHLGLMYMTSSLVDAGLWLVKSWTQATCLKQLAMTDSRNIPDTALYRLSKHTGLSWFHHVVLFSSTQDNYSPLESSRIELSRKAQNGSDKGCYFVEMAWSIMAGLRPERVRRVDVEFCMEGVSLDTIIGRKAHTEFIENRQFFGILAEKFAELFD